ncbi:hypothetical protein ES677_05825 [Bizionia gelidisalsuginis]|uniref:DUF4190 domain-containing protein n=2 Tax=Bizionia TaxID=283785 RepID=A0A8H2LBZ8_9FLAO|nr:MULTISPECIES: CCC motif membrane protein [Bizionia]TYB73129.1 hypothetical protein ES676_10260 [Bizionia saleffrena]TYC14898.1 hypothetical protein ES677_05825 [Bizionia gelidisalsuginis]
MKKELKPTLVYVLSIFSILCCCFGGLGVLLAAPAYYIANKKIKDAQLHPEEYEGNINTMNTAKIIALVAVAINVLFLVYTIYMFSTGGFDEAMEEFKQAMEEAQRAQQS